MLPSFYHAHHSNHLEDLPFWLGLARSTGSPILELGCGTGRLLAPLAKAGLAAYGLDHEAGWLKFLRDNLEWQPTALSRHHGDRGQPGFTGPNGLVGPQVFVGDMSAFHLALDFALIFLPCNTLSTLSHARRLATLDCVRRHLHPDGLFAASLPNPAVLQRLPRQGESEVEEVFFAPQSGDPVQVSSAWDRSGDGLTLWWHYDHLFPDGRVERASVKTRHTLDGVAAYRADLALSGLEIRETYGDYDREPFKVDSPYWIFVAKRK